MYLIKWKMFCLKINNDKIIVSRVQKRFIFLFFYYTSTYILHAQKLLNFFLNLKLLYI